MDCEGWYDGGILVFGVDEGKGNAVVSAEIPSIDISERPCYYSGVGRVKGFYIRVGDSDETMSEYEIYSYEAFRRKYEDDKPTLVCTLLFSFYPQMFYPQYTINAMVIMGYEKGDVGIDGARFADNRRIEGTIEDILDETIRFLTKNMSVKTIIDSHTGKRSDKPEYPVIALRETVLNALVHRDYSIHTEAMPIEVIMYKVERSRHL